MAAFSNTAVSERTSPDTSSSPDLSKLSLEPTPSPLVDIANIAHDAHPPRIPPHRSHDPSNNLKRSDPFQFGSRYLEEGDDIYEFNAWDHVETDSTYKEYSELQYAKQRDSPVSEFDKKRFNADPSKWWNLFYRNNTSNFFKNRKWLQQEFPVLGQVTRKDAEPTTILEVGAGAGNTAFPILAQNENPGLRIHACDFSKKAVELIKANEAYDEKYIKADVWDVAAKGPDSLPPGLDQESVDIVLMIFIFSALSRSQWSQALRNIYTLLKPDGEVLFRDYGRGDLAQVRFKKGRYMEENFYVRGDGTRVYFFEREELVELWGRWKDVGDGDTESEESDVDCGEAECSESDGGGFEVVDVGVDRRMLVNRQRKLKMYRCWLQGRFRKRGRGVASREEVIVNNSQAL
ncbi:MAG: hypothetical protein M1830_007001 [Pleopsidium flavum]|nr:MAG: hypothetical protein M1830_007001 [Pleopsidium flavum]